MKTLNGNPENQDNGGGRGRIFSAPPRRWKLVKDRTGSPDSASGGGDRPSGPARKFERAPVFTATKVRAPLAARWQREEAPREAPSDAPERGIRSGRRLIRFSLPRGVHGLRFATLHPYEFGARMHGRVRLIRVYAGAHPLRRRAR